MVTVGIHMRPTGHISPRCVQNLKIGGLAGGHSNAPAAKGDGGVVLIVRLSR